MVRGIRGRRLWFKPCHIRITQNGADQSRLRFPWRRDRDLRFWRRALVGARRISRASAFGKRHAFTACSSSSHKSFASQNLCGIPAISPPGCSVCAKLICQQAIRAQTVCSRKRLHPQIPVKIDTTEKEADKSQLPFLWRRDRDLNPGRHHCLTRFRIVRVQPLRHLCIGGRRAPEMQTSFYRKSAKKATDFAPSREIFCWSIL